MHITPRRLIGLSVFFLMSSLLLHVYIFIRRIAFPDELGLLFTGAMLAIWLLSSRMIKELAQGENNRHPFRLLLDHTPMWLIVMLAFFLFYALFNLALVERYRADAHRLQVISGFWLFFFTLGWVIGRARLSQLKKGSE